MTYHVAIPSYHRPRQLAEMTLPVLINGGVDPGAITVFLADADEYDTYRPALDAFGVAAVWGHGPGLAAARNKIADWYPPGVDLLQVDDDVRAVLYALDKQTLLPVDDIDAMIRNGFAVAAGTLWCLYPSANPYYMRPGEVRTSGLWYAEGAWFGYTVQGDDTEHVHTDHGEDFERSIRFFQRDGAITRLDDVCVKSNYWTEPGGLQDIRTEQNVEAGLDYVMRTYPGFARRTTTAAGRSNLRLKVFR